MDQPQATLHYGTIFEISVTVIACCNVVRLVPTKPIFFSGLMNQGFIISGNMIIMPVALKKLTILGKHDFYYTLIICNGLM